MRYEFIQTREFTAKAKKLRLSVDDIREVENLIAEDPAAYPAMSGTGGLRKMRFAPSATSGGKSGGSRVCYFTVNAAGHIWLVTLYTKNEKDNLSQAEKHAIAKLIAEKRSQYESEE